MGAELRQLCSGRATSGEAAERRGHLDLRARAFAEQRLEAERLVRPEQAAGTGLWRLTHWP